jgi:hypothetical protein
MATTLRIGLPTCCSLIDLTFTLLDDQQTANQTRTLARLWRKVSRAYNSDWLTPANAPLGRTPCTAMVAPISATVGPERHRFVGCPTGCAAFTVSTFPESETPKIE